MDTQSKKRGLGRTLDALLAGSEPISVMPESTAVSTAYRMMPTGSLQRGQYQPRQEIDLEELQELSESIKTQGIIQPILIRQLPSGNYEIIAGERRWRAAQLAGLTEVPVLVKTLTDEETLAISLIENIQRQDLNPLEEAMALHRLSNEFNLTHQEVAEAVGRSRVAVSNLLRLLTLNSDVKLLLERGELEMGHARALLSLNGEAQSDAARLVVEKGLSVRETEALVRRGTTRLMSAPEMKSEIDPDVRKLQQTLSDRLGAAVSIVSGKQGKGKVVIVYHSLEELDGILSHIQ